MFINDCLNVNEKNHLTIGGCDAVELAEIYGTPLYVIDEDTVRENCRAYIDSFKKYYGGMGLPSYASKTLCCKEICRIMKQEGMGLDVVSAGEIYTALSVGFPPEKIHFHGNNKTAEEIKFALDNKIGKFVVDNLCELKALNEQAGKAGIVQNISLRIKPGVDAHTHDFIKTGQIDSKFGFALETGEAMQAVKEAIACKNLSLTEVHCHIGSQIFDIQPFVAAAEIMMDFIGAVKSETGLVIEELNLGGGFGIRYTEKDNPTNYENYIEAVSKAVKQKSEEYKIGVPYIYIEPGRSITGEAGITLYTVGSVKTIPNVRTYVSIDGGMGDNIRYALYGSEYTLVNASKAGNEPNTKITLAGKCCESGDLIQENADIAQTEAGDIVAVLSTGAYNYSMASNYNRIPRPAMVAVSGGKHRFIINRESFEDLIRNDV